MLKRLEKTNPATVLLWLYFLVLAQIPLAGENQNTAELLAQLVFPLILSAWVLADAHRRGRDLCYDYGTFVFFAWPVFLPIYLFQTRGARAVVTLLWFGTICGIGIGLGFTISNLRGKFPE